MALWVGSMSGYSEYIWTPRALTQGNCLSWRTVINAFGDESIPGQRVHRLWQTSKVLIGHVYVAVVCNWRQLLGLSYLGKREMGIRSGSLLISIAFYIRYLVSWGQDWDCDTHLAQLNLLADLMGAHHDREYVDSLRRKGIACAVLDALALGHDPPLARWDDVTPVGVHSCKAR